MGSKGRNEARMVEAEDQKATWKNMIETEAWILGLRLKALVANGFTREEAIGIITAAASGNARVPLPGQ